jgi:[acyl-carrier-protein] S-malonyltransferase
MAAASAGLDMAMDTMPWRDARVPLVANVSGQTLTAGTSIRQALLAQVTGTVQWAACVQALHRQGCRRFLELGPGRVLSGLIRQIIPDAEVCAAGTPEQIAAFCRTAGRVGLGARS